MVTRDRVLQGIGIAIIIISISAVTFSVQSSTKSAVSPHQPTSTTTTAGTDKVITKAKANLIQVPFGAGRPGLLPEFFVPSKLSINAGDTVEWTNHDTVGHTATAVSFNSGLIWPQGSNQGQSTFKYTFNKPGTYAYFCQIHPYMSGVVFVGVQETQRALESTIASIPFVDVIIEMPQNSAYNNNYGPYFIPSYAIVPFGARVTWTNHDYITHTATATDGTFDTEAIEPGQSKTVIIKNNPSTIAYYCEIHPWMQATIKLTRSSS